MKIQVLHFPAIVTRHHSSNIKFLTFGNRLSFKLSPNLSKISCLQWTICPSFCNVQKLPFFNLFFLKYKHSAVSPKKTKEQQKALKYKQTKAKENGNGNKKQITFLFCSYLTYPLKKIRFPTTLENLGN